MLITTRYCDRCHHIKLPDGASIGDRMKAKGCDLISRIGTHAHVTGKAIAAHPIAVGIGGTALLVGVVAGSVLLGLGGMGAVLGAVGLILLVVSIDVAMIGGAIFHFARKEVECDHYKEMHQLEKMKPFLQKDQKVCLVIEAIADHNGAFRNTWYSELEKGFPVIHVKVSNREEVENAIDQVARMAVIQVLIQAAHGERQRYHLSEHHRIQVADVDKLKDSYAKLASDATILLYSCNTAAKGKGMNIAKATSQVALGRTVIAPSKPPHPPELHFGNKRFLVGMKRLDEDIMRVYKNGTLQPLSPYFTVPA